MTAWSMLLLGFGLGLRHATDADHVIVVSSLVQREPERGSAAKIAALWGAGHTVAFLGLGLLILLAEIRLPVAFETGAELLVALMLVGLGAWHVVHVGTRNLQDTPAAATTGTAARPLVVGMIHGMAGSTGIALLAATTIESRLVAAAYLVLVALGTVLGMVLLTLALASPIQWTMRQPGRARHAVTVASGALSIGLGVAVLVQLAL